MMDSGKFFRTAGTIVLTGAVQAIVFCLLLGIPLPQFTTSRNVETLQFQQLPEQKRAEPLQALETQAIPESAKPAPRPHHLIKHHQEQEPVAKTQVKQSKVLVVNFDKTADTDATQTTQATPTAQPEAQPSQPEQASKPNLTAEQIERQEAKEEKPNFVPVSDKLAGVAPDDSETEATADVNQNPTDQDSSAAMNSMEKSDSDQQ